MAIMDKQEQHLLFTNAEMNTLACALEAARELYQTDKRQAIRDGNNRIATQFERQAAEATTLLMVIRKHGF